MSEQRETEARNTLSATNIGAVACSKYNNNLIQLLINTADFHVSAPLSGGLQKMATSPEAVSPNVDNVFIFFLNVLHRLKASVFDISM